MSQMNLPFEVGHTIEARSFELGFRGAWFRCKITKIFNKGRALYYDLKYLDFTEEGIHTTKVFQKRQGENERILMIRPIREEVVVVVHDGVWKVGDLVDWWKDDCYWSGTVLEVREDDETVKIELVPEPYGEGKSYDAMFKDLRPSLEWSLEDGWTVPFSKDGEKRQCAKLMKLPDEEDQVKGAEETREEEKLRPAKKLVGAEETREEEKLRPTKRFVRDEEPREEEKLRPTKRFVRDEEPREEEKLRPTKKLVGDEETREEEKLRPTKKLVGDEETREEEKLRPTKKLVGDVDLALNIMESESIEAAVMDLEEQIVRIEWIKGMLSANSENSTWIYEDYPPSSAKEM